MDTALLAECLEQARDLVYETGRFMKEQELTRIRSKEGHANFVTDMDEKVQDRLVEGLERILPEAAILAEEKDLQSRASLRWIIDPIDGTTNYICDCRFSCISVALAEGQESVLGIVYNPYADEMFYAARGLGAYLNDQAIHPSDREQKQSIVAMGTSPYHTELADRTFAAARQVFEAFADIRRSGSAALDLCYVACGRLDGYYELILSPWDYAAGSVIIREAGGRIGAIGAPWSLDVPTGICTASPKAWEPLMEIINRI